MMNEACCSSSVRIASARCRPIPPAPTMPMMVAERVFEFEEIEHLARQHGKDLGQDAETDAQDAAAAGRDDTLARLAVDGLDRLGEQLAEIADIGGHDRQHARERTKSYHVDPDQRPDQDVDAADGIERAPRQEVQDRARSSRSWPRAARAARRGPQRSACRAARSPPSRSATSDRRGHGPSRRGWAAASGRRSRRACPARRGTCRRRSRAAPCRTAAAPQRRRPGRSSSWRRLPGPPKWWGWRARIGRRVDRRCGGPSATLLQADQAMAYHAGQRVDHHHRDHDQHAGSPRHRSSRTCGSPRRGPCRCRRRRRSPLPWRRGH